MMQLIVWDRSLPNGYPNQESPKSFELGASAIVIAPSIKEAIKQVERHIDPKDRFGPSFHYRHMVAAMSTTEPTSALPITTPGRNVAAHVVLLSIGAHYNDQAPLGLPIVE